MSRASFNGIYTLHSRVFTRVDNIANASAAKKDI